jgi:3-dehydroquinate synthase
VAEDEHETGVRALLNLGHTFGHAIEAGLGFGTWLHGEAVGAGLVMAAELSRVLGHIGVREVERVRSLVARAGLPVAGPALGVERYLDLMAGDKKTRAGALRFITLDRLGAAAISDGTPREAIVAALEAGTA